MDPTDIRPDTIMVLEARITKVNPKDYSVNLVTDGENTLSAIEVPWTTPWRHPDGGGIDFIPEVGAPCWTIWHPYDSLPTIIGFSSPSHKNLAWASGRRELNPGDIILWTRDDNRIVLRRGGNIEIVSTKECMTTFVAAKHLIEQLCRHWKMTTRGGELTWFTDDSALSASTGARSVFRLAAKRFGQDADPFVTLSMGGLKDFMPGNKTERQVFSLLVGTNPLLPKFQMLIGENGRVETIVGSNQSHTTKGNLDLRVEGKLTVDADGDIKMTSRTGGASIIARSGQHLMDVQNSREKVSGLKHISARTILLGTSAKEPAVLGLQAALWLASHTHAGPGSPPVQAATLSTILSKTVMVE